MKKISVLCAISLLLLSVLLSGCGTEDSGGVPVGEATTYAATTGTLNIITDPAGVASISIGTTPKNLQLRGGGKTTTPYTAQITLAKNKAVNDYYVQIGMGGYKTYGPVVVNMQAGKTTTLNAKLVKK